jgi:hypothetical protein
VSNSELDLIHDDQQYTIEIIPRRVGDATHYDLQARSTIHDSAGFGNSWERWDEVAKKLEDAFVIGPVGIEKLKHHLDEGKSVSVTHASGGIRETFGGARVRKFLSHSWKKTPADLGRSAGVSEP